jgi:hypothetical protein
MEMRIHYDVINIKCTCNILKVSGAQIKFRMNNGITLILFTNKTSGNDLGLFLFTTEQAMKAQMGSRG